MRRHENILANLGGVDLASAIALTRKALDKPRQPAQLQVLDCDGAITLTLHERFVIETTIKELLTERLEALESED